MFFNFIYYSIQEFLAAHCVVNLASYHHKGRNSSIKRELLNIFSAVTAAW